MSSVFRPTSSVRSLKNVFPSLHQPLPLSKNESTKLLNALTTSFRSNLDREYGWDAEKPLSKSTESTAPIADRNSKYSARHHRPTDRHLRTVLSNPLFKQWKQTGGVAVGGQRNPMDVFDEAVSRGMMTRKAATGCLVAQRRLIQQSGADEPSQHSQHAAMGGSGAGLRVVRWLRSSGEERDGAFLGDEALLRESIEFMVAEGLEGVVWEWADRLAQADGPSIPSDPSGARLGQLLYFLVAAKAETSDDKSLDAAYATLLKADTTWQSSENLPRILHNSWRSLSWSSTVEAWDRARPSPDLFEQYVDIQPHLAVRLEMDRAHLDLHHPTRPNHERALHILNTKTLDLPASLTPQLHQMVTRFKSMGLDTIKHLTDLGQTEEADRALLVLRSKLRGDAMKQEPLEFT